MIINENNVTALVFGTGDILMGYLKATDKENHVGHGIGFNQYEPGKVGRSPEKKEGEKLPCPVRFYFSNIESIDVVIKGFNIVREQFLEEGKNDIK